MTKTMTANETRKTLNTLRTRAAKLAEKIATVEADLLRFEKIKLARRGIWLHPASEIRVGSCIQSTDGKTFSRVLSIGNIRFNVSNGFNRTFYLSNGDERRFADTDFVQVHGER